MIRSRIKNVVICLLLIGTLVLCAGCGDSKKIKPDDSLKKVMDSGRFVMGFDANFPPWGYIDESGRVAGFDIDIATEVCNRMGVTLVEQPINWNTKEEELSHGKVDCIWNGMSVSDDRVERMSLTRPYMKNDLVFVVRNDSEIRY